MTEADVATKHSTGNMSKSGKQHNEDDYTIIDPMGLSVSSGKSSIITQETSTTTESSDAVTNPNNDVQVDKRNLIVNYLPQNMDDATLAAMFSNEGAVSSAKVVRDKATKKSLGFGFVKFVKEEDAKEAISARNGFVIGNKTLKVAYARPSCEEIKNCKIYVTNLPKEHNEVAVREMFKDCGEIIECRVLKDKTSTHNRGVSFIQFANKKQCDLALLKDGTFLDGQEKPLIVKFAQDYKKKNDGKGFKNGKYQYRGPTPLHRGKVLKNERFGNYFYDGNQIVGALEDAHVITHTAGQAYTPTTLGLAYGHSMKYGRLNNNTTTYKPNWVQLGDQSLLYEHLTMDRYSQHHRTTGTVYMNSPRHGIDKCYSGRICLHVAGLPSTVDVALLHDLFAPYGRVVSAQTFVDQSGGNMCSGRAQVYLDDLESAHLASQALNGAILFEGSRPLIVTMNMNPYIDS